MRSVRLSVVVPVRDPDPIVPAGIPIAHPALLEILIVAPAHSCEPDDPAVAPRTHSASGAATSGARTARRPRRRRVPGVRTLTAPLGRASQMNAGAALARGSHVLFLHADTVLSAAAFDELARALETDPSRICTFSFSFASKHLGCRVLSRLANVRDRVRPAPMGDQGLSMPTGLFHELGGFRDEPLFEDVDLVRRVRRRGRIHVLRSPARTSAVRFRRLGFWRAAVTNARLMVEERMGRPPRELVARYYGRAYLRRWLDADPARRLVSGILLAGAIAAASLSAPRAWGVDHEYRAFDEVLSVHVTDGWVDYAALARELASPSSRFAATLAELADGSVEDEAGWTSAQREAYWINAYNAFTLKLIVDHHPIGARWYMNVFPFLRLFIPTNSILMIPGRWDTITFDSVRGPITLDAIEHTILRPEFVDPRIHFAIVCASVGCPALRSHAYHAATLDEELNRAATDFIRNPSQVTLSDDRGEVEISRIFAWFREDFDVPPPLAPASGWTGVLARLGDEAGADVYGRERGVVRWLAAYGDDALQEALATTVDAVSHRGYDWSLNDVARRE